MLNTGKHGEGTASGSFDEDSVAYSLVSEAGAGSVAADAGPASSEGSAGEERGVLILDGTEKEAGDEGSARGRESASLSVPASVLLPSDVGSVAVASLSGVTQKTDPHVGENPAATTVGAIPRRDRRGDGLFSIAAALAMLLLASSFASWTSRAHRHEVLRLRGELRQRKMLLPLTLSLLKERELMREKLASLEVEAGRVHNNEDPFSPGPADEAALFSVKNCYVEASLSLGRCSREWQRWLWAEDAKVDTACKIGEDAPPERLAHEDDEGVMQDVAKLVASFSNGLASAKQQSYAMLETTARKFSYEELRKAFPADDCAHGTLPYASRMAGRRNATGGKCSHDVIGIGERFKMAWKLWNKVGASWTGDQGSDDGIMN